MISVSKMTGNEREVLHAALKAYATAQNERYRRAHRPDVRGDAAWRLFVARELLEQIDGK